MSEVRIRGAAYVSAKAFLCERFGASAVEGVLRSMDPEDAEVVAGVESATVWASFGVWARFVETSDRLLGHGDFALAREGGVWAAQRDLPSIFPEVHVSHDKSRVLVELASRVWHFYYDSGRTEAVEDSDSSREIFEVVGFPTPHRAQCERILGWLTGAHTFLGLDMEVSMPTCRARGDQRCRFVIAPRDKSASQVE